MINRNIVLHIAAAFSMGLATLPAASADAAGFANTNQSAVATAMGGVGVANPYEPNLSFYNPAAMTLSRFKAYVGDTLIIPKVDYESPDGERWSTEAAVLPPPHAHVHYRFNERLAAGVGLSFPYGLSIAWPENWPGREQVVRQSLTMADINPNVAFAFPDIPLSMSLGVQVVFASVELERATVLRGDGIEVDSLLGGNGTGLGGTAAFLYRPSDDLTLGLTYRSRVEMEFEGDVDFDGQAGTPFESTFVDQSVETEITTPDTFTFGVGYQVDRLFVEFDIGWTNWSTYDSIEVEFSEPCEAGDVGCDPSVDETNPPSTVIPGDWQDVPNFRLGAQYEIVENVPVRVGFAYDLSPIPDDTVSPSLPGNDRVILSGGAGYSWQALQFDIGYQLVSTTRTITNGNQNGEYGTDAHIVSVDAAYTF